MEVSPFSHWFICGFNLTPRSTLPCNRFNSVTWKFCCCFFAIITQVIFWAPVSFEQRTCQYLHNVSAGCNLRLNIYWYWCQASKTIIGQTQVTNGATEIRGQRKQMPVQFMNSRLRWNRAVYRDRLPSPCQKPHQGRTSWFLLLSYLLNRFVRTHWTTGRSLNGEPKQRLWRW